MVYCNYCGVELDEDTTVCPLCGLTVGENRMVAKEDIVEKTVLKDRITNEISQMSPNQKRKLLFELSGIILISGIVATFIINLIVNKEISWSKFNLIVSLSLMANIGSITLLRKRPVFMILTSFLANAMLLLGLDLIGLNNGWAIWLGLPILLSFYALIILVQWLTKIANRRGFNILAIIFLAIGIFLICIEIVTSLYIGNSVKLSWSIVAGVCLLPIAVVLFFVHYKLKTGIELRRFFHI